MPRASPSPARTSRSRTTRPARKSTSSAAADGGFTAPNINSGNYSVIVELAGFRTTTLSSVSVAAGIPTAVKVALQVGTIAENVTVVGESATVVQSQSPAISTNLTGAADHQPAADQPQRARFADVARRLQHLGHRAQLHGQRPAAQRHQHHARRHERAGQLPEDDRRLLRALEPAARLGRRSHRDDRRQHRRCDRPGRGADPLRDQGRHQQLERHRLRIFPSRRAECEYLVP